MGTMIMKCTAILALALAAALKPTVNLQLLLGFVVCAAGAAVAVFFNPVLTFQPPYSRHIGISVVCVAAFVLSLFFVENFPTKTIASITEQNPESESL